MKKLLIVLFLLSVQSISPSPFDGTWVVDDSKCIHVVAENKESSTSSSYDMQKQMQ